MDEKATVTISVDEYFDLRTKAEANMFLMERLGGIQNQIFEVERRVGELERKAEN